MSQKTRAALATEITTGLADNVDGAITPAILRGIVQDVTDSAPNTEDNDGFPIASAVALGAVKIGSGISVDIDGVISVPAPEAPVAGGVSYFAGNPSDWAGSPPTTVAEALDRLAAATPGA